MRVDIGGSAPPNGFQHQMIETIALGPVEPEAVATAG